MTPRGGTAWCSYVCAWGGGGGVDCPIGSCQEQLGAACLKPHKPILANIQKVTRKSKVKFGMFNALISRPTHRNEADTSADGPSTMARTTATITAHSIPKSDSFPQRGTESLLPVHPCVSVGCRRPGISGGWPDASWI